MARDEGHVYRDDLGSMLTLGSVEVLAVNGDRTAGVLENGVVNEPHLRTSHAILASPAHLVPDCAVASLCETAFPANSEGDAEFILAQTHDEWVLCQGDAWVGCCCGGGRDARQEETAADYIHATDPCDSSIAR